MSSAVEIANLALVGVLGHAPIVSFADDNKAGRTMDLLFEPCRDAVLRLHPWNFATSRAVLAQLGTSPPFGFTAQFALPSDFLRVLRLNEGRTEYRIEAGNLLTDADRAELLYTARITDTGRFDPLFVQVLAAYLAVEAAIPITNSLNLKEQARSEFREKLQEARSVDGMDNYQDVLIGGDFIDAFLGDDEPFRSIADLPAP